MIENNKYENGLASRPGAAVKVRDGLTFLLIGGGIGALLALLFAPKSGSELRGEIADVTRRGYDATLEKAGDLRAQSADAFQAVKHKAEAAYDFASTKLNTSRDALADAASATSGAVVEGLEKIQKESGINPSKHSNQAGIDRKGASIF